MYFGVNLIHMFLINLCLAHQNVVLRRKAYKKNRVMLHQPLMKSTPEDCSLVRKSDRLRVQWIPKFGNSLLWPQWNWVCSTLGGKKNLTVVFFFFFNMCLFLISGCIDLFFGLTIILYLVVQPAFMLLFI